MQYSLKVIKVWIHLLISGSSFERWVPQRRYFIPCSFSVSRQTVLIVLENPKLHGLFSGHITPYVPLKMPTVFKVDPYANKNKRHTTLPRCTE